MNVHDSGKGKVLGPTHVIGTSDPIISVDGTPGVYSRRSDTAEEDGR